MTTSFYMLVIYYCLSGEVDKYTKCKDGNSAVELSINLLNAKCETDKIEDCVLNMNSIITVKRDDKIVGTLSASILSSREKEVLWKQIWSSLNPERP